MRSIEKRSMTALAASRNIFNFNAVFLGKLRHLPDKFSSCHDYHYRTFLADCQEVCSAAYWGDAYERDYQDFKNAFTMMMISMSLARQSRSLRVILACKCFIFCLRASAQICVPIKFFTAFPTAIGTAVSYPSFVLKNSHPFSPALTDRDPASCTYHFKKIFHPCPGKPV